MTPPLHHKNGMGSGWRVPRTLRSLTLKLTLAFLAVGLLGALLVAFFVGLGTQRAFTQFFEDRGRNTLVTELQQYYRANGSWNGVAAMLEQAPADAPHPGGRPPQPVLIGTDGRVIMGSGGYAPGARIPPSARDPGIPIIVNEQVVGWLVNGFGGSRPGPGTPESDLLMRISRAITFSAIGAVAIALLLGVVLARTLTHPLRELTAATQAVAKGALGRQVTVRSRDELGVLAVSFNQMSADLAHASSLRRQMTADIAHDLRTPLSVILGYTEALRDGKLPAEQDIFDTLHIEAQHLQHLIDDLRTLSLTDAGELPLTRQPVAPKNLLERTAAAYRAQAQDQQIALQVQIADNVPDIDVDPERMAQVLGNLVSNALRFTPAHGAIVLSADAQADSVQLRVQDSGSGIAPDDLPHVFERFYKADAARQQGNGSSGLGLAIAKGIVQAHSGSIGVDSAYGAGTTFTIRLPAHALARRAELV